MSFDNKQLYKNKYLKYKTKYITLLQNARCLSR